MRRSLFVIAGLALLVCWAPPAAAKGPTSAQLTGPGLRSPIELTTAMGVIADRTHASSLVFGLAGDTALAGSPPDVRRGPEYRLRFSVDLAAGGRQIVLDQHVFPFAEGGALVFTPPGQRNPFAPDALPGGWSHADPGLTDALVDAGVPTPAAPAEPSPGRAWLPLAGVVLVLAGAGAARAARARRSV